MHEYAFDIQLDAVARVKAASLAEAVSLLRDKLNAFEPEWAFAFMTRGTIELTEATMNAHPEPFEMDGEPITICPNCKAVEGEPEWGTVGDGAGDGNVSGLFFCAREMPMGVGSDT